MSNIEVEIFTDGACRGNPGPGGWAALLRKGTSERLINGAEASTTNNRMELVAAIRALEAVSPEHPVAVYTDSQYVRNGVTQWISKWRTNGWKTAAKKPVKNQDLWKQLDVLKGIKAKLTKKGDKLSFKEEKFYKKIKLKKKFYERFVNKNSVSVITDIETTLKKAGYKVQIKNPGPVITVNHSF